MLISIITLFPDMFGGVFDASITKRAKEEGKVKIQLINLRDFGIGKHRIVDDTPYGGGVGMILKPDVIDAAITATKIGKGVEKVGLLDPKGEQYTQERAEELSQFNHLILVCGHYEGFDERIRSFADFELSIGDYVLSGGEIPAMVIIDSLIRLIPGVLKKDKATKHESFSHIDKERLLEHPHYTRPRSYKGQDVPEVLLSGNQKAIEDYRSGEALLLTQKKRPDILKQAKKDK